MTRPHAPWPSFTTELILACVALAWTSAAQTIDPEFRGPYTIRDLGAVSGLTGNYGGVTFQRDATNTLLIGGGANEPDAKIYAIQVARNPEGHITGFVGTATALADATAGPESSGGIDGGLCYGPDGVLFYTVYPDNFVGQIKPGSTGPDKLTDLVPLGIADSVGGLVFVPTGFPGAGRAKFLSYEEGAWYDTTIQPDGSGTFNVAPMAKRIEIGGSPEGAFYVAAGSPMFAKNSVLVADYGTLEIVAYEIDGNGDPVVSTKRLFISDLEGATGAAADPVTGDFLFTSFGTAKVYVVGGFKAQGATVVLTEPPAGSSFGAPASLRMAAEAEQAGGFISKVEFYVGTKLSHTAATAPYEAIASGLAAGAYSLTAVAYDGSGQATTSAVVNITVTNIPPDIQITSPASNAEVSACAGTFLRVAVTSHSGTVTNVQFYSGATLLGASTAPPFGFEAGDLPVGPQELTARAFDDVGSQRPSAAVPIVVVGPAANHVAGGLTTNGLCRVCFNGTADVSTVFEATTNFLHWTPIATNQSATGVARVIDADTKDYRLRFYRTRQGP